MESEIQEMVQKTIREFNSNFWNIKDKLTNKQLKILIDARKLISSILVD